MYCLTFYFFFFLFLQKKDYYEEWGLPGLFHLNAFLVLAIIFLSFFFFPLLAFFCYGFTLQGIEELNDIK